MREGLSSDRRSKLGDKRCELFILIRPKKQSMPPNITHYNPMGHFDQNTVPNFNVMHPNKFQNNPNNGIFQSLLPNNPNNNNNNIFPNPNANPHNRGNHMFDKMNHMNMNPSEINPNQMMPPSNHNLNNNFMNKPHNYAMRPPPNQQQHEYYNPQQQQQQQPFPNSNNQSIFF